MRPNYTLTRLYVDADLATGMDIVLPKEQAHYLANVLRMDGGGELRVFNGRDGEWKAVVTNITRKKAELKISERLRAPQACPDIWLCFAPVRKHRNAFILEKATELGVAVLQPVVTARTQFAKLKLDKMQSQIIEAAEQTERLDLPQLNPSTTLEKLLQEWQSKRILIFADEAGDAKPALETLQNISGPAALLIGPEGGFSDEERRLLRARSFVRPVSLGPRILRADTAALALLTLWQAAQGDWT
ncbi:MAG: 16S rRNA (uracil(1498)-N(3))-methyltransferase [Hellea sp.]|nr:16S rRNA (uracil(1498)-N(3))-methyltransferase [Hellea sp.]